MSRYRSSDDFGGAAAGSLVLVVIIICVYVMVRLTIYIIRTFVKYHEKKVLWIALAVFGALSIIGIVLYLLFRADWCFSSAYLGFLQLLIVCYITDLRTRDTLIPEKTSLQERILGQS